LVKRDRRNADREDVVVAAACRVRGIAYRTRLSAVSHYGCCAEMAPGTVAPGERVLVQLGRLLVLPAVVCWVEDGRSGLEFANPLHGAMLSWYASGRSGSWADLA
jgi:hypothetical protein